MQDRLIIHHPYGKEIIDLTTDKDDILFTFNEFERVEIENQSAHTIYYEHHSLDTLVSLEAGHKAVLNDYDYLKEGNTFYPERYVLYLDSHTSKPCYFEVQSNALGSKINDIRHMIEDFAEGLSKDLNHFKNYRSHRLVPASFYEHIISNEKVLLYELEYIINHPEVELTKQLMPVMRETRMTRKSEKYAFKTGMDDDRIMGYKTIQNRNNKQNIALKQAIMSLLRQYDDIILSFQEEKQAIEERLDTRDNYRNHYLNKQIKTIEERINHLGIVRNRMNSILSSSWLHEVQLKQSYEDVSALSNFHYKRVFDAAKGNNINHQHIQNSYKKTSELYELYALILIFKILEEQGYEPMNQANIQNILEGDEFIFIKDERKIKLAFNQIIAPTNTAGNDALIIQNGRSNKPDIAFMVYDHDELVDCLIFEVKCRKKYNFYNEAEDTAVMNQLHDYTNLWYKDNDGKVHKGAISMVYVLYPDAVASLQFINANQIGMLALQADKHYKDTEGYHLLFQQIHHYIK